MVYGGAQFYDIVSQRASTFDIDGSKEFLVASLAEVILMPEAIKRLLHQMTQNHQILLGCIELGRWEMASVAARDLAEQAERLIEELIVLEDKQTRKTA